MVGLTRRDLDEPSGGAVLKRLMGRGALRLVGWRVVGDEPDHDTYVLIAAPHTSNWDAFYMLAMAWALGVRLRWLGKQALFKPPLGWLLKLLGGISVDRSAPQGLVEQVADRLRSARRMVLAVPAEGTRKKREYWKSGFYHIASAAEVPIVMGFLDYSTKQGGFGQALQPTGDVGADMDVIRAFYADKRGKYHERYTAPRLRLEVDDEI